MVAMETDLLSSKKQLEETEKVKNANQTRLNEVDGEMLVLIKQVESFELEM